MRDYRKIKAWQSADDLTVVIYRESRYFPVEERYGLTSQLRRAAYSVPANIAEGSARNTKKDYLHFLYISRGSLTEVQYFVHLAKRLDYVDAGSATLLESQVGESFRLLHGLIGAVEKEAGIVPRTVAKLTGAVALLWSVGS